MLPFLKTFPYLLCVFFTLLLFLQSPAYCNAESYLNMSLNFTLVFSFCIALFVGFFRSEHRFLLSLYYINFNIRGLTILICQPSIPIPIHILTILLQP